MSDKLIDATELVEALGHHWNVYPLKKQELIATVDIIAAMPEAVVRCKDCVNRGIEGECPLYESAYITGGAEGSNFFCSYGERREDG